jgi:hypothetical protein
MSPEIQPKTTKEYLISINQQLQDFIQESKEDKVEHSRDTLIKLLGG